MQPPDDHSPAPGSKAASELKVIRNGRVVFSHRRKDRWIIYALCLLLLIVFVYVQVKFLH